MAKKPKKDCVQKNVKPAEAPVQAAAKPDQQASASQSSGLDARKKA